MGGQEFPFHNKMSVSTQIRKTWCKTELQVKGAITFKTKLYRMVISPETFIATA